MAMEAGLKRRWLVALRSGRYKQGRQWLRADGKYCCLGVLCNVVAPRRWSYSLMEGGNVHPLFGS